MDAEFWVAIGFIGFILLAAYFGGHKKIGALLDTRGETIRDELAEAERMRKEAADILASFEGKRAEAEKEAADLVAQARAEADLMAKEAEAKMAEFVKRRTAQAEAKIANAETQALAQVHATAADAAAAAAEIVLRNHSATGFADGLIKQSIADVKGWRIRARSAGLEPRHYQPPHGEEPPKEASRTTRGSRRRHRGTASWFETGPLAPPHHEAALIYFRSNDHGRSARARLLHASKREKDG